MVSAAAQAVAVGIAAGFVAPPCCSRASSVRFLRSSRRHAPAPSLVLTSEISDAAKLTFEPVFNPSQLVVALVAVCLPFAYWWFITVPEQRLTLSKDKRQGATKEYIAVLRDQEDGRTLEKWFFQKWLRQAPKRKLVSETESADDTAPLQPSQLQSPAAPTPAGAADGDAAQGWGGDADHRAAKALPTVEQPVTLRSLFTPSSNRRNRTPRFWSGDNPIVVTTASLLVLGVAAALARESSWLAVDAGVMFIRLTFGVSRLTLK